VDAQASKPESPDEHAARGRAARKLVRRSSHGEWSPAPDRPSARSILAEQDADRVPDLVPIRYGRMLDSAFSFYRGAAAVMASDLGATPNSGLEVQLCGDAHLSNFGFFAAPDRRLVFDLNDFDETLPGPFEWDVKRMAASFAVGGRARGFDAGERRKVTLTSLREYREAMRRFAAMGELDVWYARLDVETVFAQLRPELTPEKAKAYEKRLAKARRKDSRRALSRLTEVVGGRRRIVSDPPVIVPVEELRSEHPDEIEAAVRGLVDAYQDTLDGERRRIAARYRYVHAARKVVGVGSVGTEAWIVLTLGRDGDDPLVLQAKEAKRSVLEPYTRPSEFAHQGRRVVEGQRLMQAASDIFLGWVDGADERGIQYYVRQLWDGKRSAEIDTMTPNELATYARLCGWTLARAHARSGDRIAIAAYLGGSDRFDAAVADFAELYADRNEADHRDLTTAVADGELQVQTGV
jgi:uncharacterized protein (DUF2252 family)